MALRIFYKNRVKEIARELISKPERRDAHLSTEFGINKDDLSSLVFIPVYKNEEDQQLVLGRLELLEGDLAQLEGFIMTDDFFRNKLTLRDFESVLGEEKAALVRTSDLRVILKIIIELKRKLPERLVLFDWLERETYDFEYSILYDAGTVAGVLNINDNIIDNIVAHLTPTGLLPRPPVDSDDQKFELSPFAAFFEPLKKQFAALASELGAPDPCTVAHRIFCMYPYTARLLLIALGADGCSDVEYVEYSSVHQRPASGDRAVFGLRQRLH